jgi:hypothetical protein
MTTDIKLMFNLLLLQVISLAKLTETRIIKASIISDSFYGEFFFTILADNAPLSIFLKNPLISVNFVSTLYIIMFL